MNVPVSLPMADPAAVSKILHRAGEMAPGGALCLAVDAGFEVNEPLAEELDSAVNAASAVAVPLRHPEIDKVHYPRWLSLNTEKAKDSFVLQDSIARALAELSPQVLRGGAGRRIAGWIELDGDIRQAAVHIGQQMIRLHSRGHRCLVRLHDPAVMWAAWPLLTGPQQRQLLGPVKTWWLLDPSGQLTALRSVDQGTLAPWTTDQWTDIDNITPMNHALRAWLSEPALGAVRSVSEARSALVPALRRAIGAGFSDQQDLAAFALHALTVHPHFDAHPAVQRALAKRQPGDHYTALIEALTEQDWLAVRENRDQG